MTSILPLKSGDDWNPCELILLKIEKDNQKAPEFFGRQLSSIDHLDPNLLLPVDANHPFNDSNIHDDTYRFLANLKLTSFGHFDRQATLKDFTAMMLDMMGYVESRTILRRNHPILLATSGKHSTTTPDLCLYHCKTSMILLVARVSVDPTEAQLIADAIAVFQHNNDMRARYSLPRLDPMIIPCFSMIGIQPRFYMVPVTQRLSDEVAYGVPATQPTIVPSCIPPRWTGIYFNAMVKPEYRQIALQYFETFRVSAKDRWSQFIDGFSTRK